MLAYAASGGAQKMQFIEWVELVFSDRAKAVGKLILMQKRGVNGVHNGIQNLNPVAFKMCFIRCHHHVRNVVSIKMWESGNVLGGTKIGKNQPFELIGWIGAKSTILFDFFGANRVAGLTGNVENAAINIKMPAVITTTNTTLGYPPIFQRSPSVWTVFMHQADASLSIFK